MMGINRTYCGLTVLLPAALAVLPGCEVHHRVHHIETTAEPDIPGIIFSLPKTQATITVPIEATIREPGPFFMAGEPANPGTLPVAQQMQDVIDRLIGLEIVRSDAMATHLRNKTFFSRKVKLKPASLSTAAVWDSEHLFLIEWPDHSLQAQTLNVKLSELGFLTESTSKKRDQTLDMAVKVAEISASIAGKAFGVGLMGDPSIVNIPLAGQPAGKYEIAQEALDRIEEIRTVKRRLIEGTSNDPPRLDKDSLLARLQLLDQEEAKAIAFFIASKSVSWNAIYRFEPGTSDAWCAPIGLLDVVKESPTNGNGVNQRIQLVHGSELQTLSPIPDALSVPTGTGSITKTRHAIEIASLRDYGKLADQTEVVNAGFRYRLPGEAEITYAAGDKQPQRWTTQVAQFGVVRALPTSMGTADSAVTIGLYEQTGVMKSVNAESTVTLVDQLDAVGGAVGGGLDQIAAIRAANAGPSELDKLNAQNAALDAQLKNLKLQKELEDFRIQTLPGDVE